MDVLELMKTRHSVRQYSDRKIEPKKRAEMTELARMRNQESGLNIQIFLMSLGPVHIKTNVRIYEQIFAVCKTKFTGVLA